ncbi:unnamed protein product [Caenorhabditis auriculariae]|uniref:Uncharacterized protein n=1 Tax=Caenorhabditis auriculariae TaxID=2777116 RepID=A0A8S1HBZ0_9PELO|nr:unnamed protein product [Caenorhabditis auriculariae]
MTWRGEPLANHKVNLYERDYGFDLDDRLNRTSTDRKGRFEISGFEFEFFPIEPYLLVFTECVREITCVAEIDVPPEAVVRGPVAPIFDMGTFDVFFRERE